MMVPIKLIIADDHEVFRDGLKTLLGRSEEVEVIAEASNGKELISICQRNPPDIVLMDIMMPVMDGIEATAYLSANIPSIRVIALSMFNQDNLILDMINAGATGYLIKNANKIEIIEAILSVNKNIPYYCKSTSIKLARLLGSTQFGTKAKEKLVFSDKELAIIRLICEEKTSKEIGDELYLSARTVEEYRLKIREKMEVKSTTGIVIYAVKNGIVNLGKTDSE